MNKEVSLQSEKTSILKDIKNILLILISGISTKLGNVFFNVGLNLWILQSSGNTLTLGIISSLGLIPTLVFTLLGGVISDSYNKKYVIVICDVLAGLMSLVLAFMIDNDTVDIFYITTFMVIMSVIRSLFNPAIRALPAYTVSEDNRGHANSLLNISAQAVQVAGPVISSAIIFLIGLNIRTILLIKGTTLLMSALVEIFIEMKFDDKSDKTDASKASMLNKLTNGWTYLYQHKDMMGVVLLASLSNIFIAGYNLYLPFYANYVNNNSLYGMLLSLEAAGGIIGSLMILFIPRFKENSDISIYLLICGIIFLPIFLIPNLYIIGASIFLFGLFLTIFNVNFFTYLQNKVEKEFIGRVISITTVAALLLMPLGQVVFSFMMDFVGINSLPLIGVGICMVCSVIMLKFKKVHL